MNRFLLCASFAIILGSAQPAVAAAFENLLLAVGPDEHQDAHEMRRPPVVRHIAHDRDQLCQVLRAARARA